MSDNTFKFSSAQRFRVVSGVASFYTTAGEIRTGLGDFTNFNSAARTALAALEADHPNSTGIAGRWQNADVQLDISR